MPDEIPIDKVSTVIDRMAGPIFERGGGDEIIGTDSYDGGVGIPTW